MELWVLLSANSDGFDVTYGIMIYLFNMVSYFEVYNSVFENIGTFYYKLTNLINGITSNLVDCTDCS